MPNTLRCLNQFKKFGHSSLFLLKLQRACLLRLSTERQPRLALKRGERALHGLKTCSPRDQQLLLKASTATSSRRSSMTRSTGPWKKRKPQRNRKQSKNAIILKWWQGRREFSKKSNKWGKRRCSRRSKPWWAAKAAPTASGSVKKRRRCGSRGRLKMSNTAQWKKSSSKNCSASKRRKKHKLCSNLRSQALIQLRNCTRSYESVVQALFTRDSTSRIGRMTAEAEQPVLSPKIPVAGQLLLPQRSLAHKNGYQGKETKCSALSSGMEEATSLLNCSHSKSCSRPGRWALSTSSDSYSFRGISNDISTQVSRNYGINYYINKTRPDQS